MLEETTTFSPAIIGRGFTVCLEGSMGGTNGTNFFTVQDREVHAVDITNRTNPGNTDVIDFVSPICDSCSCVQKYTNIPEIANMLSTDLEETGFASFIVTMFVKRGTDRGNSDARLCYGLRNRFVVFLMVREILSEDQEPLSFGITLTSALPYRVTRTFDLPTSELMLEGG